MACLYVCGLSASRQGYPADPLLHACIVCASVSCPDVAMTAYRPETLQADMEANMRLFLENPTKGLALNRTKGVITLSKVIELETPRTGHDSPARVSCFVVDVHATGDCLKRTPFYSKHLRDESPVIV